MVDSLAADLPSARWIGASDRHVTVRFLGSVAADVVPSVTDAARLVCDEVAGGGLSIEGIGAFPKMARARVLWAGVNDEGRCAAALFHRLDRAMSELGLPGEDRDYVPHLTLARFKAPTAVPASCEDLLPKGPSFRLSELLLIESTLTPAGARYEVKESFPLG